MIVGTSYKQPPAYARTSKAYDASEFLPADTFERTPCHQANTLLYSDIDDTLLLYNVNAQGQEATLAKTRAVVNSAPELATSLSTARPLEGAKELAPLLKGFPISFIGVRNGFELYLNRDNQPAEEWLRSLSPADQDPGWAKEVARRLPNWDQGAAIPHLLQGLGFAEVAGTNERRSYFQKGEQNVAVFKGSPGFILKGFDETSSRQIVQTIRSHYDSLGIETLEEKTPLDGREMVQLLPAAVNKTALLEYCLSGFPNAQFLITAGDSTSDSHIFPDQIAGLANHRVVSGSRPEVLQRMGDQDRVFPVETCDLGAGLEHYMGIIRDKTMSAAR